MASSVAAIREGRSVLPAICLLRKLVQSYETSFTYARPAATNLRCVFAKAGEREKERERERESVCAESN